MRKCYQSFKRLLTGQEGSMAPVAVAATIAMLFIILGVSEYMRLVITAAGIKDAMESAVVSVVNDNYNEVYHGVREGYAADMSRTIRDLRHPWTMGISMAGCVFCLVWKRMGTVMSAITTVVNWSTGSKIFLWTSTTRHWHRREELIMRMQRSRWKCLCVSQEKSCRICRSG